MKILVFNWQDIKNPFGGGAEVHFHEIFKRIAAMGNEVTLFCSQFAGALDEEIIDGIRVIREGTRNFFNFNVKNKYNTVFSKENFDIVIDDLNKIPFYTPRFVKEPLIVICHHFFGKSIFREAGRIQGSYVYFAERRISRIYKNTPFAVVSESTKQECIERGIKEEYISIVPNAINQNEFPMAVGEKYDFPCVAYFGRMKKYKSVDHLLKAFALIKNKIPTAQLHLLGRGDNLPELKKLAKNLGISDRTTFFGYVSEEDKKKLLSKSHIVVNTSMKEGWGITNIEANACGTPVLSADVPGLRDSVAVGKSGLLYEYGNIKQLSDLILELFTDKIKLNNLSHGAVEWASIFSWDDSAMKMLKMCEEVIERK
ncbi:MAG: glycosyltransferase family 4 protein [FCB group bacterium]|jgi:glycosyltransferase involved in cell wall biosynthesis